MVKSRAALAFVVAITAVACKRSPSTTSEPAAAGSAAAGSAAAGSAAAGSAAAGSAVAAPAAGSAAPAAAENPDAIAKPFFYSVEKDGKTSHMLGTFHIGVDAEKKLPRYVFAALDRAKTFAMETNIQDPSLLSLIMRDDGSTLADEMGPEYFKKFEDAIGPGMARGMNGMKIATAVAMVQMAGMPLTTPMDSTLAQRAQAAGKDMVYLEPAAMQAKLLDKWLDLRTLKYTLDHLDQEKKNLADGLASYLAGDDTKIVDATADLEQWTAMGRTKADMDEFLEDLLYARNASWIPELERIFAKGDAFVAVGAAHLVGPKSVPELLTAKGYKVTRVTSP